MDCNRVCDPISSMELPSKVVLREGCRRGVGPLAIWGLMVFVVSLVGRHNIWSPSKTWAMYLYIYWGESEIWNTFHSSGPNGAKILKIWQVPVASTCFLRWPHPDLCKPVLDRNLDPQVDWLTGFPWIYLFWPVGYPDSCSPLIYSPFLSY